MWKGKKTVQKCKETERQEERKRKRVVWICEKEKKGSNEKLWRKEAERV